MLACESADREGLDGPETDEATIYRAAAAGDHDAQVEMARRVLAKGMEGAVAISDAVLLALQWTNMAATSGKATHALAHAGTLMIQAGEALESGGTQAVRENLYVEALAIIDAVASAGHARAELISMALAAHMAPESIARAQVLGDAITIDPLTEQQRLYDQAGLAGVVAILGQRKASATPTA